VATDELTHTGAARTRARIYLNDHRAGAAGGLLLARRCLANNRDTLLGADLERLVTELEEDASSLEEVMRRLDVPSDRVKRAAAWAGERLGRLKPNGQLTGYSPLSRLLELELLLAGIDAKRSLWRSLAVAALAELDGIDFERLIERATDQRQRVEHHHEAAARAALL